jgi:cation diffusion facilitator family transporter
MNCYRELYFLDRRGGLWQSDQTKNEVTNQLVSVYYVPVAADSSRPPRNEEGRVEQDLFKACQPDGEKFETSVSSLQQLELKANVTAMVAAFVVGMVLMGLKFLGFWITGSSAILSDALESIINVVASGFGLGSVVFSAKPADESHPYGHGQIDFFSAGFEGALIIAAAIGIFYEGLKQILNPHSLPHLEQGLFFLFIAGAGNLILGVVLLRVGKRTKSLVLEADGIHLLTDVLTSGAVLIGVAVVYFTGWYRFDGIVACFAGLNIIYWGSKLVRQAFGGLMHASDPHLLDEICDVLVRHKKDMWIDVHRLRAWKSGKRVHVDFHLVLPRDISLESAHREVKELEAILSENFGGWADVLIHLDPCIDPECPVCGQVPCNLRHEDMVHQKTWNRQTLIVETKNHR